MDQNYQITRVLKWLKRDVLVQDVEVEWEADTCEWLFHHDGWKEWHKNDHAPVLWI